MGTSKNHGQSAGKCHKRNRWVSQVLASAAGLYKIYVMNKHSQEEDFCSSDVPDGKSKLLLALSCLTNPLSVPILKYLPG